MTTETDRTINTNYPNAKPGVYQVAYACSNCGWTGKIPFTKGKVAPGTTTCPTCGVSGTKKSLPYRLPAPAMKDPVLVPIIPGACPKNPPCPVCPPPANPYKPYPDITQRQTAATKNDADHCTGFRFEFGEHPRRPAHGRGVRDWEHP